METDIIWPFGKKKKIKVWFRKKANDFKENSWGLFVGVSDGEHWVNELFLEGGRLLLQIFTVHILS